MLNTTWATHALKAAAERLELDEMRDALAAGADAKHADVYSWGSISVVERVLIASEAKYLDDAIMSARQCAALRLLAEHGGWDADAASALLVYASLQGRSAAVMQVFLDAGAGVHAVGEYGITALHYALHADVARQLIAAGADVHAVDTLGKQPLFYALFHHLSMPSAVIDVLLEAGADVDAVNPLGQTCLLSAALNRTIEDARRRGAVQILLAAGADPTIAAKDGDAPLPAAVARLEEAVEQYDDTMDYNEWDEDAALHATNAFLAVLHWQGIVITLARATAWWRRRHMLASLRSRDNAAGADDAAAVGVSDASTSC